MNRIKISLTFISALFILIIGCEMNSDTRDLQEAVAEEAVAEMSEHSVPEVLYSSVISDGRIPTVALDSDTKTLYVAFFKKEGEVNHVYVASKSIEAEEWNEPVRASNGAVNASVHGQAPAQIVVGPEGNVYVVWTSSIPVEGRRFPASDLLFARSLDGGQTFEPQQAINSDAGGFPAGHTFHDITVANDGTIYASWLDSRERYKAKEKATIKPVNLSANTHSMHEPGTQVWVAFSKDHGETFSDGTVVAKETCQCCRTSIMVADDNTVYVAWRHIFPNMERDMALAHSKDGGQTFSKPHRIFADNWSVEGCPHSGPSLTIDESGTFHASWYTGVQTHPGLYYSTSSDGMSFSDPVSLVADVGVSQVLVSGHGQARTWITWEDKKKKGIQVAYTDPTGSLVHLDDAFATGTLPSIVTSSAIWAVASQVEEGIQVTYGSH